MSPVAEVPPAVVEALARGWTVVTGNQRAARTLRQDWNAQKRAAGAHGWAPPSVLAWDTWLGVLWRRLVVGGKVSDLLLDEHQEHVVWREILRSDPELAGSLRPVDSLADLVAGGWELLNRFGARVKLDRFGATADARAFGRWTAEFERRCAQGRYLSRARLPEVLREAFAAGDLPGEAGLHLVGFDRKTPDQVRLLEAAERAGVAVSGLYLEELDIEDLDAEVLDAELQGRTQILAEAANQQAELVGCARWLREFLESNPQASAAVIVPGLGEVRGRIDRTFREILAPELEDIAAAGAGGPYEFSLGVPLASTALARTALDVLAWAVRPLSVEEVSRVLLSPYIGGGDGEYLARAEFDAFAVRRETLLLPEISVGGLARLASEWGGRGRIGALIGHLRGMERLLERVKPHEGRRSHAAWCAVFQQILEVCGWTSRDSEQSLQFQTRRRWAAVLDQVAALDFDGKAATYEAALDELRRIAEGTLFAVESHGAPVQIMGPLEAAGSQFDAVWFIGAGDLSWPAGTSAHPLLPLWLQRELGMPGADPALDMELAQQIAVRLAASAGTVVFSYAQETADSYQRPSAALAGLGLSTVPIETLITAEVARAPVPVERFADEAPIPPLPDGVVRGGSQILELQAACAFRAFAEKRLGSAGLQGPEAGLDSAERGNLVHQVLEEVWKQMKTQSALRALGTDGRRELLAGCVGRALATHMREASGWQLAYLEAERERLLRLLGLWLEKELERPAFAVLDREEKVAGFALGPLRIDVRLDRVDVLLKNGEPAGEIVVDYKTGSVTTAAWSGERPDDPQVPLYALVRNPETLSGVTFARVRAGRQMGFAGQQREPDVLMARGKVHDLSGRVEEWRETLTRLAEQFSEGVARVDPKQYPATCRYCGQRVLCRLDPRTLDAESLEDLADPDQDTEAELA